MPKASKQKGIIDAPIVYDSAESLKERLVQEIKARYDSIYAFARHEDAVTLCNLTGVKPTTIEASLGKACTSLPILQKIANGLLGKSLTRKSVTTVTIKFTLG